VATRSRTASLALIQSLTAERDELARELAAAHEREGLCRAELDELRALQGDARRPWLASFADLVEGAPDGIVITTLDGAITYANAAFQEMTGYGAPTVGMHLHEMIAPEERRFVPAVVQRLLQAGIWQGTRTYVRRDGRTFEANISLVLIRDAQGQPQHRAAIIRDLTRQRRLEHEQLLLQEQVIADQQSQLRDLSAPVLRLAAGVVVVPIAGSIDDCRADEIVDAVLAALARQPAATAIIDIGEQPAIGGPVAKLLLRAAQALSLLDTRVMVTGAQPGLAGALSALGLEQLGVTLHATLQEGVGTVLRQSNRQGG
jgi:PAS domain S-box-containing protein